MQVKSKWYDGLNKENLKLKLYIAYNFLEEASFVAF